MKEELYQWIKNLAVFYILLSSILHLVPNGKYEKYVRFFMGLLLIFMMSTPIFALFGKRADLAESFRINFDRENFLREQGEYANLQEICLEKGYEAEIRRKILFSLKKRGIEPAEAEVNIEGEKVRAVIYMEETPTPEQEGGISDGLMEACGIGEGEYQIQALEHEPPTVGGTSSSGTSSGSGSLTCFQ